MTFEEQMAFYDNDRKAAAHFVADSADRADATFRSKHGDPNQTAVPKPPPGKPPVRRYRSKHLGNDKYFKDQKS